MTVSASTYVGLRAEMIWTAPVSFNFSVRHQTAFGVYTKRWYVYAVRSKIIISVLKNVATSP